MTEDSTHPRPTLRSGEKLGPYELLSLIGIGGMGEVWKARDSRLNRIVAIKHSTQRFSDRFEREAKVIASLNHPHICTLYDIGPNYLVMEFVDGKPVRGPLPLKQVLQFGIQIAEALHCAHLKGIIHRDLKPSNILATKSGVKLLDFGLAKVGVINPTTPTNASNALTVDSVEPLTKDHQVLGTLQYMSPEQLQGEAVDARSDIYSFGLILYEMLCGKPAFQGRSQASLIAAILKEEPAPLVLIEPTTPPVLDQLVQKCLAKDPEARWQSVRDLAFSLEAVAGSDPAVTVPIVAGTVPSRRWNLHLPKLLLAFGLLAAGIFVGTHIEKPAAPGKILFEQKTYDPQFITNARFLPDGKGIVFSAALEGNLPELFVIHASGAAPEPLRQKDTHLLSVSRNGELAVLTDVSYLGQRLYRGTLSVMTLSGAPKSRMTDVREADWAPNGSDLALIRDAGASDRLEYPPDSILYKSTGYLSDLRVSPDGNQVAFFEHPGKWDDRGDVMIVDRASNAVKKLAGGYWGLEGLAWTPDGTKIVFSASNSVNKLQPYIAAISGSEPANQALPTIGPVYIHDIARDGRWIIANQQIRWFVRFKFPDDKSEQEISYLNGAVIPYLSLTGRSVLFTDQSPGGGENYTAYFRSPEKAKPVRFGEGRPEGFSPDGTLALIHMDSPPQLLVYPVGPGKTLYLDRGPIERYQAWAQWFPDGKQVLFCGNEPSNPTRCYRQAISSGPPTPVTPGGFSRAWIAPDGRTLLALGVDGACQIMSVDGEPLHAPRGLTKEDSPIKWAADSHSFFVYDSNQLPAQIEKLDLFTGQRKQVGDEIAPEDRAGLVQIRITDIIQEGTGYAYYVTKCNSELFLVQFAKQP